MHEIVPDISTWAWFSEPHGYNFNGYLVRHPEVTSASIRYRRARPTWRKSCGWASPDCPHQSQSFAGGQRDTQARRREDIHPPRRRRACQEPGGGN